MSEAPYKCMRKVVVVELLLIIGMLMLPITASAYTTDPLWSWDNAPLVCVWDSDYNWMMTEAVNEWWVALTDRYGEEGGFPAVIVDGTEDQVVNCKIHIVLTEIEYADNKDGILGITFAPNEGDNAIYIAIYETNRPYDTLDDYNQSVIRTITHELGHAFGLGHWIPDNMAEALRPWPDTLMWAYQDEGAPYDVDEYTLDQFEHIYGPNGWVGSNDNRGPLSVDYLGVDIFS